MMAETCTRGITAVYRDVPSAECRVDSSCTRHAALGTEGRWSERVILLQQHARTAVAQVADLRLDVALERNLAMAGVHRRIDADLLQLVAESLRREMRRVVRQRLLI